MQSFNNAATITVNGMPAGKDANGKDISAPKEMTRAEYEEMRTNDFYSMMPLFVTPDGSQAYPPPPSKELIDNFNKSYDIMVASGCEKWSMNSRISGIDLNHPVELVNGSELLPLQQMQAPPDAGKIPYPGDWFAPRGSNADQCGINDAGDKREYGSGSGYNQFGFKTINGAQEQKVVADYPIPPTSLFIKSTARAITDTWSTHGTDGKAIPKVTLAGGTQYNILGSATTIAAHKNTMMTAPVPIIVISQETNQDRKHGYGTPIIRGNGQYKKIESNKQASTQHLSPKNLTDQSTPRTTQEMNSEKPENRGTPRPGR